MENRCFGNSNIIPGEENVKGKEVRKGEREKVFVGFMRKLTYRLKQDSAPKAQASLRTPKHDPSFVPSTCEREKRSPHFVRDDVKRTPLCVFPRIPGGKGKDWIPAFAGMTPESIIDIRGNIVL
jgi:hypothetical protein